MVLQYSLLGGGTGYSPPQPGVVLEPGFYALVGVAALIVALILYKKMRRRLRPNTKSANRRPRS